jgi:hypothetical protein
MLYFRPDERERLMAMLHGTPQPSNETSQLARDLPSMPTTMPVMRSEASAPKGSRETTTEPTLAALTPNAQQAKSTASPEPTTIHVREAPPLQADVGAIHAEMGAVPATASADTARPAPSTAPSEPEAPKLTEVEALAQSRSLWGKAIDAEAKHDYAAAVGYYEKIQKLPRSVWPAALKLRLDAARKHAQ